MIVCVCACVVFGCRKREREESMINLWLWIHLCHFTKFISTMIIIFFWIDLRMTGQRSHLHSWSRKSMMRAQKQCASKRRRKATIISFGLPMRTKLSIKFVEFIGIIDVTTVADSVIHLVIFKHFRLWSFVTHVTVFFLSTFCTDCQLNYRLSVPQYQNARWKKG